MEYWKLEPFGDEWRQTALVAWMQSQQLRMRKRMKIDDFMPYKPRLTKQEVAAKLNQFFNQLMQHGKSNDRQHDGGSAGFVEAV
jgi:hypothetical protein